MHVIISLFWLILSVDQLARNVCHSSEVEPASGISTSTFFLSVLSLLPAIHLSFLSLLWITGTVHWESCPNTFVLPKQSIADSCSFALFWFVCLSEWLRRSHGEVTRGPAGQLVLIASRGLFFWGPPSQPGCSDVRRAGHQPSGNVQAATHRGNRRTAQTHKGNPHAQWCLLFRFLHTHKS